MLQKQVFLKALLWNIIYNGGPSLRVQKKATTISFAEDLLVFIILNHPEDIKLYGSETIHASNP